MTILDGLGRPSSDKTTRRPARFDSLEPRLFLAASAHIAQPQVVMTAAASATPVGFAPSVIDHAYAFDQIHFSGAANADGSGQTIAIVDAYDDPTIASDLATFDTQFGLPAPPSFTKVAVANSTPTAPQVWLDETALDVEWMHALAPGANIVVVEAATDNDSDLVAAVAEADNLPNVTTVSMSWGDTEYSGITDYDPTFQTPAPHQGMTFVASSGDIGAPGLWPALSPYVLSVGATTLTLNNGDYGSETAWSKSGGGYSQYEPELPYQDAVNTTGMRASPDVAFDGNPNTGVAVYESGSNPGWRELAGTSFSAVAWAALITIANQGRAAAGLGPLDEAQADLYQLPASDFHDITSGGNGTNNATAGYDLVTGLGTPIANLVVNGLIADGASVGKSTPASSASADSGSGQTATVNQAFAQQLTLTVHDGYGDPLPGVSVTFSSPVSGASASFPGGATLTTNSNGQVSVPVMANTIAGSYTVNASVAGLTTPITFSLTNSPDVPASISTVSGDGQQATVNDSFGQPLIAVVRDQYGNAVPGVAVTLSAPASGASASLSTGTTLTTDSQGQASEAVDANTVAGSFAVSASVAGVNAPATFSLTDLPGSAATITALGGNAQDATVASAFGQDLTLVVRDQYGNPVPGVAVAFSAPASGASASLSTGATLTTDGDGQVSESVQSNTVAGGYTVSATVAGVSQPLTFSLTNLADVPASISVASGGGQQATVATGFGQALTAVVRDRYGNAVPGATVTFTAPASGPGASFATGASGVTNSNGQASVNVTGNTLAGMYTVTASVSGVVSAADFQLTNLADSPTSMSVALGDKQQTTIGSAFAYPLTLDVVDRFGNSVPGVTVTFTAPSSQASAALSAAGTATTNGAGEASVAATANDLAGSYTIVASAAGVSIPVSFRLANEPTGTRTTVNSSTAQIASVFGQPVSFTATVAAITPGVNPPMGQVTFLDNGATLGTANLNVVNGVDEAVFSPSTPLAVGQHPITAQYAGDANDTVSNQSLTQTVSKSDVMVGVESSAPEIVAGPSITLTAVVVAAAPGAGTPTGSVDFVDTTTGANLGSATLSEGRATLNVNDLAVGSHVIAATYSGDGDFLTNTQSTTQTIVPVPMSSVTALKAVSLPTFTVSWSSSDAGGPGIAGYTIDVSDNGGSFNAWLSNTAQTSAVYQGTLGHTYQFYSVAADTLGDVQPTPAAPQASTAALANDKNGLYVVGVYQDVLGRLPDQAGLSFWTAQLDAGTPISSVAASIVHSAEYYAKEVIEPGYLKYLGRPADATGIAWWTAQLQGGMSDEQFEASLIASDEFYANAGDSDQLWVDAVYQSLLGRPADGASQTYWVEQLAGGMSRSQAALMFATSSERESARIQSDYEHYLGRPADGGGLSFWLSQFSQGASNEDLITEFVSSSEYYQQQTS